MFAPELSKNTTTLSFGPDAHRTRLHGHRAVRFFVTKKYYTLVGAGHRKSFAVIVYPRKHGSKQLSKHFGVRVASAIAAHLTKSPEPTGNS